MKRLILMTALVLTGGLPIFAQTVEKEVAAIRAEVAGIERAGAKYTKKTLNVEGISLEGTEATYYFSGKGLKKIAAQIYGESYRATLELYYQGEELIFAYRRLSKYEMPINSSGEVKIARVEETRSYFANGKMLRFLDGKKEIERGAIEFDEQANWALEISDAFRRALAK